MSTDIVQQMKKVGGRFAFEFFLEVWKGRLVDMVKKWLSGYTAKKLEKMVKQGKFPDVGSLNFKIVKPYYDHLEKISVGRFFEEYLASARPDLAQVIQDMGMPGAEWLVKLRLHLLEKVRTAEGGVKEDIVQATCDACGKSWPVPRAEFSKIEACPFCDHKQEEAAPTESKADQAQVEAEAEEEES